ncbi:hypothetical protein MIMGU_mgv1a016481mg [Erythranthe guttata]|uniref:Uncharacterized protein n=1 Tax=Erythranthe guttata TaxID=4155 RepID=A0A022RUC7_ERYGU|nr:hypothetical protein MIMGU_mgv1a016481mg [Erythranthe guttata]
MVIDDEAAAGAVGLEVLVAAEFLLRDNQPPVAGVVPCHHPRHLRRLVVTNLGAELQRDGRRVLLLRRVVADEPPQLAAGAVGGFGSGGAGPRVYVGYIGSEIDAALATNVISDFCAVHGD